MVDYTKEQIIDAIVETYESKNVSSELLLEAIKKKILEGKITQLDVQDTIDKIVPPIEEIDESGNVIGVTKQEILTEEDIKTKLILEASVKCNQRILAGFESSCLGEVKVFDCEFHDQSSIQGLALAALLGMQGLTTEECHWKAKGELECYKFEYAQILQLATDLKKHVESNINQFNAERLAILNNTI